MEERGQNATDVGSLAFISVGGGINVPSALKIFAIGVPTYATVNMIGGTPIVDVMPSSAESACPTICATPHPPEGTL